MTAVDRSSDVTLDVFNLLHDHRPDRVAVPTSADEVAELVRHAVQVREPLHVVATGHGLPGAIVGGTVVSTKALAGVQVDPTTRTARIGAGTRWGQVVDAAAPYGLGPVCGSSPTVGVVGMLLGGGLGPVGRTLGWGSDHVRGLEIVTGAGDLLAVGPDAHPELFRAARGGRFLPGVVTSVEIDLPPVAELYGGGLFFDGADAAAVLHGFVDWSRDLPDSVTASFAVLRLPDLPPVPAPIRGRCVVHLRIAVLDAPEAAAALVAPLRGLATPLIDVLGPMPYAAIAAIHADPVEPMPVMDGGVLINRLDHELVDVLLGLLGPEHHVPFSVVEVRLLGGALARPADGTDVVVGRDAAAQLFLASIPVPELFATAVPSVARALAEAVRSWSTGVVQPNFVGALSGPDPWTRAWSGEDRTFLAGVRAKHDPAGLFASTW